MGFRVRKTWLGILLLSLIASMTFGDSLNSARGLISLSTKWGTNYFEELL